MSYNIIFETKVVELSDGRILHLSLQGCNNDNAGRTRDDFRGTIYSREAFITHAEHLKKDCVPYKDADNFTMKIYSRYATSYDYGEHLLRMLKKAVTWDELKTKKLCYGHVFEGITLCENGVETLLSPAEWEKVAYDFIYGRRSGKYSGRYSYVECEPDIVAALEANKPVSFYIGK